MCYSATFQYMYIMGTEQISVVHISLSLILLYDYSLAAPFLYVIIKYLIG